MHLVSCVASSAGFKVVLFSGNIYRSARYTRYDHRAFLSARSIASVHSNPSREDHWGWIVLANRSLEDIAHTPFRAHSFSLSEKLIFTMLGLHAEMIKTKASLSWSRARARAQQSYLSQSVSRFQYRAPNPRMRVNDVLRSFIRI